MNTDFDLQARQDEMRQRLAAGDFAGAAEIGRAILRRFPRHLATYRDLAWAALLGGQQAQAMDLLRRVLSADPEDGEAWAHLAQLLYDAGQRHESATYWAVAFDLRPWGVSEPRPVDVRAGLRRTNPQRLSTPGGRIQVTSAGLGHLLARGRHWRRAVAQLRPLVASVPERQDLKLALAGALWQAGETRTAQGLARDVLQELPHALKAHLILAAGSGPEAAAAQQQVAALDPLGEYAARWFGPREARSLE